MITGVPTSTAIAAVVLAGAGAMHAGRPRTALFLAAGFLPFSGLVISFLIASQPLP